MGKPTGRRRSQENVAAPKPAENKGGKPTKAADRATAVDEDTAMFISMSHDLKEEGNKLFQKRDHEGAMLKYEKALKLLPKTHIDVAYLRVNMAACYMEMGLGEYPRAINEYNLALEVSPKYSKAMLKRAKCYEALNKLDFAFQDVHNVLSMEPNNSSALEVLESVKKAMIEKGIDVEQKMKELGLVNKVETRGISLIRQVVKEKLKRKKKSGKSDEKHMDDKAVVVEKASDVEGKVSDAKGKVSKVEEKMSDVKDKEVVTKIVEEQIEVTKGISQEEKLVTKTVKLVFGEDIRWAQLPVNCSIRLVRDIVRDRFPSLNGVLMKYKDPEGDLVTITTTDELRLAELLSNSQGSLRLFIAEVSSDQEPAYEGMDGEKEVHKGHKEPRNIFDIGKEENDVEVAQRPTCIEEWIVQFARLFKNHVGLDTDSYLDLHELGMKLYSEAMEDAVTSEEAQELFEIAADKFQEMAALALFNWGNIHMSRARKRIFFPEDGSQESVLAQVKSGYEWAKKEYTKAGMKYEEAMKIKPDFYEGFLASGQQKFEEAKLCWCHAIGSELDEGSFEGGLSKEVLELYDKSEDSMERGMQMWEEMEEKRLNGLSKFDEYKSQLQKMGLDGLFKDTSPEEAAEQAANMRSQINLLWGTMLYERSVVEYRLELPTWEECLEVSVEKFELAGASPTDIAVMIKSHCSNQSALEGFGFKIDEIVQAWNEMYDAKRWQIGVPSFRLEPLFRRRSPKLHDMLENI